MSLNFWSFLHCAKHDIVGFCSTTDPLFGCLIFLCKGMWVYLLVLPLIELDLRLMISWISRCLASYHATLYSCSFGIKWYYSMKKNGVELLSFNVRRFCGDWSKWYVCWLKYWCNCNLSCDSHRIFIYLFSFKNNLFTFYMFYVSFNTNYLTYFNKIIWYMI